MWFEYLDHEYTGDQWGQASNDEKELDSSDDDSGLTSRSTAKTQETESEETESDESDEDFEPRTQSYTRKRTKKPSNHGENELDGDAGNELCQYELDRKRRMQCHEEELARLGLKATLLKQVGKRK
jgi:hypothetical protein